MTDTDKFKAVNHWQRHEAGDDWLVHISETLQSGVRSSDP